LSCEINLIYKKKRAKLSVDDRTLTTPIIHTRYVTKKNYKLKKRPICHNVKASTEATLGRDHVHLQWSAFRQSRQTINLLDVSKITTLLYLDLCLFTIIYYD